jgi:hypothetical protein
MASSLAHASSSTTKGLCHHPFQGTLILIPWLFLILGLPCDSCHNKRKNVKDK